VESNGGMTRILFALLVAGCTGGDAQPAELKSDLPRNTKPAVADGDFSTFVDGNTQFALDMYDQLRGGSGNLIMSPISITEALGMTYAGAADDTATQMATALDFTLPVATTESAMDQLDLDLAGDGAPATNKNRPFQIHVVDALWAQKGIAFEQPYLDTLATDYGAGVFVEDFASDPDAATDQINDYVSNATDKTIPDLIPPGDITPETVFVLTNSIYFQAAWATPFEPSATAPGSFTRDDGSVVQVSMMNQDDGVSFGSGSDYVVAELPYDGNTVAMYAIEPTDTTTGAIGRFEASLDAAKLASVLSSVGAAGASLQMPKVTYSSSFDLVAPLEALGMVDAFDNPDFSAMTATQVGITDVVHQGYLKVDEAGTVASGATGVVGTGGAAPQLNIALDHPYLIVIRDLATGSVLFFGRVSDPSA
jgi:serpin B